MFDHFSAKIKMIIEDEWPSMSKRLQIEIARSIMTSTLTLSFSDLAECHLFHFLNFFQIKGKVNLCNWIRVKGEII